METDKQSLSGQPMASADKTQTPVQPESQADLSTPATVQPSVVPPQAVQPANTVPPTSTAPEAIVADSSSPKKFKLWMIILILALIVVLVAGAGYYYMSRETELPVQTEVTQSQTTKPQVTQQDELDQDLEAAELEDPAADLTEVDKNLEGL